ncbi:hypothetical protein AB7315_13635 [Providencia manganoxydans]|uniref:hypothetical protein n=1 Tax=Providencia manganoxydans TaxID=2923283 RepID=UPI0034E3F9A6
MAKTAAERKAAQRKRQKESGETKLELLVDAQELEMVNKNRVLRRPGKEPYEQSEYIQLLIRHDNERLEKQMQELEKNTCTKCGDKLPVTECCLSGDSKCWLTNGHNEFSLSMARIKFA